MHVTRSMRLLTGCVYDSLFQNNPDGVVAVKFRAPASAAKCIEVRPSLSRDETVFPSLVSCALCRYACG